MAVAVPTVIGDFFVLSLVSCSASPRSPVHLGRDRRGSTVARIVPWPGTMSKQRIWKGMDTGGMSKQRIWHYGGLTHAHEGREGDRICRWHTFDGSFLP